MSELLFNGLEKFEPVLKRAYAREYIITDKTYIEVDHINLCYFDETDTIDKPCIELTFNYCYMCMGELIDRTVAIVFENTDSLDFIEGLATQAIRNAE